MPRPSNIQPMIRVLGAGTAPDVAPAADVVAIAVVAGHVFAPTAASVVDASARPAVFVRRSPFVAAASGGPALVSVGVSDVPDPAWSAACPAAAGISCLRLGCRCLARPGVRLGEGRWDGLHYWGEQGCFLDEWRRCFRDAPSTHEPRLLLWLQRLRHLSTLQAWKWPRQAACHGLRKRGTLDYFGRLAHAASE